jgi:hypothetical protein
MSDKEKYLNMHKESTPGINVNPDVRKMSDDLLRPLGVRSIEERYKAPVRMRFEWAGRIYEGTAYYVKDVSEE